MAHAAESASAAADGFHGEPDIRPASDHYENPRNAGDLDKASKDVGTGIVGAPAYGDVMQVQIRVGADGRIAEAKFKTFGCGSASASSSVATEWVVGKSLDQCQEIKSEDIASRLNLPPDELYCSHLAEEAVKGAVKNYIKKQQAGDSGAGVGKAAATAAAGGEAAATATGGGEAAATAKEADTA